MGKCLSSDVSTWHQTSVKLPVWDTKVLYGKVKTCWHFTEFWAFIHYFRQIRDYLSSVSEEMSSVVELIWPIFNPISTHIFHKRIKSPWKIKLVLPQACLYNNTLHALEGKKSVFCYCLKYLPTVINSLEIKFKWVHWRWFERKVLWWQHYLWGLKYCN